MEGITGIMTVWITDQVPLLVVITMVAVVQVGVIVVVAAAVTAEAEAEMEALVAVVADFVMDSHSKSFIALYLNSFAFYTYFQYSARFSLFFFWLL